MSTARLVTLCVHVLFIFAVLACDDLSEIIIRNESASTVIYKGNIKDSTLMPGDEISYGDFPRNDFPLRLETEDGQIVFDGIVTWSELEMLDFIIVVTDEGVLLP